MWVFLTVEYLLFEMMHAPRRRGLNEPQDWPSAFGNLSDGRTVRRMWGYVVELPLHRRLGLIPGSDV